MIRGAVVCLICFAGFKAVVAQPIQFKEAIFNDIRFRLNVDGNFFENAQQQRPFYRIPATDSVSSIYAASLWLLGRDDRDSAVSLTPTYSFAPKGVMTGPGASAYFPAYYNRYYNAWFMSKSLINQHRQTYNLPGYTPIPEIFDWPAKVIGPELSAAAPFNDVNNNGFYDPENGDYPAIPGDLALFYVQNTVDPQASPPIQGSPFKLVIRGFLYAFENTGNALQQTLFSKQLISHLGSETVRNVYAAQWMDVDLGQPSDDAGATDSLRNLIYAYNQDNFDDEGSTPYGINPPAQGFVWLSQPMDRGTVYTLSFPSEPFPDLSHYYRLATGVNPDGTMDATRYDYPGSPAFLGPDTELENGYVFGDRRLVSSVYLGDLAPGQVVCLDGAYVWSRSGDNHFDNARTLQEATDQVTAFYRDFIGGRCNELTVGIADQLRSSVQIHPNPTSGVIYLDWENEVQYELSNASGQRVGSGTAQKAIDFSGVSAGFYILTVKTALNAAPIAYRLTIY
ncbi:MAG TPA: T9SS type A sorting domain-containing protein [Luteibaculaceae bacterium]|nr:T9SS type A sorting domain-containing protein [Luteibaculaceae bacterium]